MNGIGMYAVFLLVGIGLFFTFVAAVGLIRLPDLYTRAHASSKIDTLGAAFTLAGVALIFGVDVTSVKILLLLVFLFITNPTAAHAITRAAYDQGIEPWTADEEGETR